VQHAPQPAPQPAPMMQQGPQNGRPNNAPQPAPAGSGMTPATNYVPQPAPMQVGPQNGRPNNAPQQPLQYGGRGQTGMPLPPGLNLSPEEMEIVRYLRSTQDSPF